MKAPTFRTAQGVNFVNALGEHRPTRAAATGRLTLRLDARRRFHTRRHLLPHPAALVGVPAIVADQMGPLRRNVLREFGQVQGKHRFLPGNLEPLPIELGQFHKVPCGSKRAAGQKRMEMRMPM